MVDELIRGGGQAHAQVGGRGKDWTCRSGRSSMYWGSVVNVMGKAHNGSKRHCAKGWVDAYIYRSKSVSLKTKCQLVVSHVFSTSLKSSANWTWNIHNARMAHRWETKILRFTFRQKMHSGEERVTYQVKTVRMMRIIWKNGLVIIG